MPDHYFTFAVNEPLKETHMEFVKIVTTDEEFEYVIDAQNQTEISSLNYPYTTFHFKKDGARDEDAKFYEVFGKYYVYDPENHAALLETYSE